MAGMDYQHMVLSRPVIHVCLVKELGSRGRPGGMLLHKT